MGDSNKEQPKKAMFKTQTEAEAAAPEFGCTGAHQMGEMWMVCEKHEQAGHKGHHEFTRVVGYAREASPRRRSTSSGLRRSKSRWAGFLRWDEPSQ